MPNNIKWGSMPFNHVRDFSSTYKDGKSTNNLVNNVLVIVPANGYVSKADKPQYNGNDPVKLGISSGMVVGGKIICQLRPDAIGTLVNYESDNETADIEAWKKECLCVIQCVGNKHLEAIVELYSDFGRFANTLTVYPNESPVLPTDEEKESIKAVLVKGRDDWAKDEEELIIKFNFPSEPFNAGIAEIPEAMLKVYKSMFGYAPKSIDELKAIADKIKLPEAKGNGNGKGKGGSGYGGGATVNVYQNETSLDKFKAFIAILGLPANSTVKTFVTALRDGSLTITDVRITAIFCNVNSFVFESALDRTVDDFDILDVDKTEVIEPSTDVDNNGLIERTIKFVESTLGKERGKLPKDWAVTTEQLTPEWCENITKLLSENDYTDAAFHSSVRVIMGDDKQTSLVLYTSDQLKKIIDGLSM